MSSGCFRAVCLTGDPQLRTTLGRALPASGATVEFGDADTDVATDVPDLVILDAATRRAVDLDRLSRSGAKVAVVGDSLAEDEVLAYLRGAGIDHVIGRLADVEEDLLITSGK